MEQPPEQPIELFTTPENESLTFQQILEKYGNSYGVLGNPANTPTTIGSSGLPSMGIKYTKSDGTNIFSILTSGVDVGDIITGNYAGGKGMKWDQSAEVFSVKGDITGSSGTFSGTLAANIVTANSIQENAISIVKISSFSRIRKDLSLESADTWEVSAGFGFNTGEIFGQTGSTINTTIYGFTYNNFGATWTKNLILQNIVKLNQSTNQTFYFGLGKTPQIDLVSDFIGFKVSNGTLYAINAYIDADEIQYTLLTEITGITITNFNVYKIMYYPDVKAEFYINGVLKVTHTTYLPIHVHSSSSMFSASLKNTAAENKVLNIIQVYFESDL